ncbi:hypothetical protein MXB_1485, partial [Myxobolus squamalis]
MHPINIFYDENTDEYSSISEEEDAVDSDIGNYNLPDVKGSDEPIEKNLTQSFQYHLIFPDYSDNILPAGVPIRVAITVLNHEEQVTLVHIYAALHHPKKASHSIQNFTAHQYELVIPTGIEVTVLYTMWLHHSFAERLFYLTFNALLTDNETDHYVTLYNTSHTFLDLKTSNLDFQL